MLNDATVPANIPAADLNRAREFYADKLGLTPSAEIKEARLLVYTPDGGSPFSIYETQYAGMAGHTIAQFHVADVAAQVRELKAQGVAFEQYDMPGVEWDGEVASLGEMGKAAWFKDSEGNILCVDDGLPGAG
jgi:predicted enzyme related to lactoylglutathione lyase